MAEHTLLSSSKYQAAEKAMAAFCQKFPLVTWKAGHAIIEAGKQPSTLYYLTEGSVKMASTSSLGNTVTLHMFYPGAVFSFLSFVSNDNTYDFTAVTDVKAHTVPYAEMTRFLQTNADATLVMNLKLLKGLQGLLHRIEQSVFVSAYYQVAGILHYFARHSGESTIDEQDSSLITTKITHKDISEWLGLSRENVSLHMKQLERDGVIARKGRHIQITNPTELDRLATPQDLLL